MDSSVSQALTELEDEDDNHFVRNFYLTEEPEMLMTGGPMCLKVYKLEMIGITKSRMGARRLVTLQLAVVILIVLVCIHLATSVRQMRHRFEMQTTIEFPLFLCTAALCVVSGVLNCVLLRSPLLTLAVPDGITAVLRTTYNSTLSPANVVGAELRHMYETHPQLFHTRERYMRKTCFPDMDDFTWTRVFQRQLPQQSCTTFRMLFVINHVPADCSRRQQYCLAENNILPQSLIDAYIGLIVFLLVIIFCYSVSSSIWPTLADNIVCDVQLCCIFTAAIFVIKAGIVIGANKAFFDHDEMESNAAAVSHYGVLLAVTTKTYHELHLMRLTIVVELILVLFQLRLTSCNVPKCQCQRCHHRRRRRSVTKLPALNDDLSKADAKIHNNGVSYSAEELAPKLPWEFVTVVVQDEPRFGGDGEKKLFHGVENN